MADYNKMNLGNVRWDSYLYPPLEPHESGSIQLDDVHTMYWEECGNPEGAPVLCLHGGPGGGINPYYRQLFDPNHYRIILYDQRGCGQSTPFGELEHNTTQHLLDDIETLRHNRGIEKWLVVGGSWGSSLGLAYAEAHGTACAGLVVSGIFLCRKADRDWWWHGLRRFYPEAWQALHDFLPEDERDDLRAAYYRRCTDSDPSIYEPAALALTVYETQTVDHLPNWDRLKQLAESDQCAAMGRLLLHYDHNNYFLKENQLLDNIDHIRHLPGAIVNGRFDVLTTPGGAFDLHQAWPEADFTLVPAASHAWSDLNLGGAMVRAIDDFKRLDW